MRAGYRYMTLWYQESHGDSSSTVPFGVIVETRRYVYYLGFDLGGDESTITGQILRNFPDVLKEQIAAAAKDTSRAKGDILDVLQKSLAWNIRAEAPTWKLLGFHGIEGLARKLFEKKVSPSKSLLQPASSVRRKPLVIGPKTSWFKMPFREFAHA